MSDPNAGLAPGPIPTPTGDAHQAPQPQQPQLPQNNAPVASLSSSNNNNEASAFKCLWQNCLDQFHQSAEQLYDHVCDKHIGRKSTNNLNLQCAWANCTVQVVKRDHITSHIRVHVPLKPHRCQFCGKTFKRPQDLKKHVKTHADDTVLNGINQNAARDNHQHQNGAFNMGNQPKGPGYYPEHHHMQPHPPMGYGGPTAHGGAPTYYAPTQQQQGYGNGYGTVSYTLGSNNEMNNASFDSSKTIANLNAFIGEVQRGLVNTKSYNQVSNRLMPLQQSGVPYLLSGGMADYQAAPPQLDGGVATAFGSAGHYSLPAIDGLRTKDQLLEVAHRFEQMAATVYEAAEQTSAAGVGQPDATFVDAVDYRPQVPSPSLQLRPSHLESPLATQSNHSGSTPVLTPPSSAGGYTSAHSPGSNHSNHRHSPATPNGSMYPNLPGPSMSAGYPSSSMAPTATLGAHSANDYRQRRGGGYLQKAQPVGPRVRHNDEMDTTEDNATTPKKSEPTETVRQRAPMAPMQVRTKEVLPSNIDPALAGEAPPSAGVKVEENTDAGEDAATKTQRDARWVDTIRTLDVLKHYIQARLANNDFVVEGEGEVDGQAKQEPQEETAGLYPALPQQVEASG